MNQNLYSKTRIKLYYIDIVNANFSEVNRIKMNIKCPKCGKEEFESLGEEWCYECKNKKEKLVCMNCLTSFFECGHISLEKKQCSVTKSR